MTSKCIWDKN